MFSYSICIATVSQIRVYLAEYSLKKQLLVAARLPEPALMSEREAVPLQDKDSFCLTIRRIRYIVAPLQNIYIA